MEDDPSPGGRTTLGAFAHFGLGLLDAAGDAHRARSVVIAGGLLIVGARGQLLAPTVAWLLLALRYRGADVLTRGQQSRPKTGCAVC
jgi:hypothetical protein